MFTLVDSDLDMEGLILDKAPGWTVSVAASFAAIGGAWIAYKLLVGKGKKKIAYPPGLVILHQYPRGRSVPSYSPACLKLETFLRMSGIPYENRFGIEMSKKGKLPFITYEGEEVADSNLVIPFLCEKFKLCLDDHLEKSDEGIGHAVCRMIEEHFYFILIQNRWLEQSEVVKKCMFGNVPDLIARFVMYRIKGSIENCVYLQGVGRHDYEERMCLAFKDLDSLCAIVGEKKFLLGSAKPSIADCTVFATLCQLLFTEFSGDLYERVQKDVKYQVLRDYTERMKKRYWPDWNEECRGGVKRKMQ